MTAIELGDALREQAAIAHELLGVAEGQPGDPPSGAHDVNDEDRRANEDRGVRLAELVVALDDRLRDSDLRAFLTCAADAAALSADLGADDTPPGPVLQRWTIAMGAVTGLGADCAFDVLIANLHGPVVMLDLLVQRGASGGATSETVDVDAALALGRCS
jgi:hypothetical protein